MKPDVGHDGGRTGSGAWGTGIGIAILVAVCCAGPALLASGALAAIGGFPNPWLIGVALLLLAGVVLRVLLDDPRRCPVGAIHRPPPSRPADEGRALARVFDHNRAVLTLHLLENSTEHDATGAVAGFGLTGNPTPHRVEVEGSPQASMWEWCAMDTLVFPVWLNREFTVVSSPPGETGQVRLRSRPDGPDGFATARAFAQAVLAGIGARP